MKWGYEMNLAQMKRKYAYTLAKVGLNVQKGQPVLVEATVEGADFTPVFAEECYKLGASNVIVHYLDVANMKVAAKYRSDADIRKVEDWEELIAVGTGYMRLTVLGLPFVAIMAFVTSTFQGHSNTKTPMLIAMLVNISNIVLGYVLIFGVGGIGGFGIYGAAIALSASRAIGAITGLILLFKGPFRVFSTEQLKGKRFQYDWVCIKDVYSTGIPAAVENFFWQFSAIIMSRAILTYGEVSFSAYQIGLQAEDISGMATFGFGVAATTLSAKAIGMRDGELFRSYFREDVRLCSTISVFTSLALILLPTVFMSLMTNNPEIQRIGAVYVFVMGFIQIPQNLSGILSKTLLSSGYKNTPMIISFVGIWLIRIPLALLVTYVLKWDVLFIWLCIALDQLSRFIINVVIMKRKNVLYTAVR